MKRQPAGMGTKYGPIPYRPPVVLPPCRQCGVTLTTATMAFTDRGSVVCRVCGIGDPVGIGEPRKTHATACPRGPSCGCPWPSDGEGQP